MKISLIGAFIFLSTITVVVFAADDSREGYYRSLDEALQAYGPNDVPFDDVHLINVRSGNSLTSIAQKLSLIHI